MKLDLRTAWYNSRYNSPPLIINEFEHRLIAYLTLLLDFGSRSCLHSLFYSFSTYNCLKKYFVIFPW